MTLLAYIDPGLGALLWQSIMVVFIGFLFYLKKTRRWVVSTFRKIFRRGQKTVTKPETSATDIKAKTKER